MIRRRRIAQASDGSAAVEFAIIAPVLILSILGMAEIGFSIHEASRIDQAMRNGVEVALDDPGAVQVEAVLDRADWSDGQGTRSDWSVERRCECPSGTAVCGTGSACSGNQQMDVFYDITGSRFYEGIFLSPRSVSRTASVQVR